jgi:selenocysteine lyase/cysteine desulfurase
MNIIFVLDAAQSAGHLPIDIKKQNIDILCAPAHKGLFGIQGCGFMLLGERVSPISIIEGGNGVDSLEWRMPSLPPESLEAGTLPTPCIVSLSEGIRFLAEFGSEEIYAHERSLFAKARDSILNIKELRATVYMPECEGSVLLFNLDGIPSERVGRYLGDRGICVRSGYHCSALGHKAMGTLDSGAVRVSFSLFNTERDVDSLLGCLCDCAAENKQGPS